MFVCVGEKEREENRESYTRYRGYAVLSSLNGRPTGSKQQRHISRQSGPSVNVERRASGEREKELRSVDSDRLCLSVTFLSFFLLSRGWAWRIDWNIWTEMAPMILRIRLSSLSSLVRLFTVNLLGQTSTISWATIGSIRHRTTIRSQKIRQYQSMVS